MGDVRRDAAGGEPTHEHRKIPLLPGRVKAAQSANGEANGFGILDQQMIGFGQSRPATGKANDENPTKGRDAAHGLVKDIPTHRIVDDIRTTASGQVSDLLSKAVRVVDHMVGPQLLTHGKFFCRARRGDDGGAQQFAHVDGRQSHTAGGTVY